MRLALELPYGRYVKRVVFLSKNRGDGKSIGGDVSEATSSATPRQRMGVDTMDLQPRGHCVHRPRIMPQLVHSVHRGHCVSGVLSSGSRIYLGGRPVVFELETNVAHPRSVQ